MAQEALILLGIATVLGAFNVLEIKTIMELANRVTTLEAKVDLMLDPSKQ